MYHSLEYCNYVLTGDGDESIIDFVNAINNGSKLDFKGLVYKENGKIINTGKRELPNNISTIPNRDLVYRYSKLAKKYDTLWAQVHASRGASLLLVLKCYSSFWTKNKNARPPKYCSRN